MQEGLNGFPHWMLKEIFEQPDALDRTLAAYGASVLEPVQQWLEGVQEIVIAASGSSRHAGLVAELILEDRAGIHVDVEYASEYVYRSEARLKQAAVIVVSQSGETADTLAALRKAKEMGQKTLAITNVATSSMAREADVALTTQAGVEKAIPATKSFTTQLLLLAVLAEQAASQRGLPAIGLEKVVPQIIAQMRAWLPRWQQVVAVAAGRLQAAETFLFLGRGVHYAIAREGALKLKESSYIHAEGYPSGELKHGPNALVGSKTPLVMLATVDHNDAESVLRYEKVMQLMQDMRAQGAPIMAIANEGDVQAAALADAIVEVPAAPEHLLPILEVVPLQLFAYFMAIGRGIDVDKPRNLVKSVVVE